MVRVTCLNNECHHHLKVFEYTDDYRQHSICLCGSCGGELHELQSDEEPHAQTKFRRVALKNPLHPTDHPRMLGLTNAEREAGWEVRPMVGKVPPDGE